MYLYLSLNERAVVTRVLVEVAIIREAITIPAEAKS